MTSNLLQQLQLTSKATSLDVAPPLSKVATVSTMRGQALNLPEHQIPIVNPNAIVTNTWNFAADSSSRLALQNPGVYQIKIARGQGSGKTSGKVWLRLQVNNSGGSSVQTVPAPFWFSLIQFQTPGGDVIQNRYPFDLWFSIIATASEEEWLSLSDLIVASNNYQSGQLFAAGETKDVWIPLIGNPYSCGEIATRELEGDSICYLTFADPSNTIESGSTSALVINSMYLVFEMQQLDESLIKALDKEYSSFDHSFMYPWVMQQDFTQTWNTDTQYTLQLTGITGDVVFFVMVMRESSGAWDAYHGQPIKEFQFQNQEGVAISGSAFIPESYNRWGQATRWFLGTWMQDRRYYTWIFPAKDSSAVEFLSVGRKNGAYGFTGNEQLVLTTAPAGTSEVIFFDCTMLANPAAESRVFFQWTDEYGVTYPSPGYVDMSATSAAALKAAIEAIPNFEGEVTVTIVSGGATAPRSFNVAFTGNYANRPLSSKGYQLKIIGTVNDGAGTYASFNQIVTTAGVRGITNGSTYTLSVYAYSTAILSVSSDQSGPKGRQRVQY
jgi:hypothetical protein